MNLLVPMAGLGSRFRNAGYRTSKPLIPVLGRPMYAWAVDSLPLASATRLIFVLLKTEERYRELEEDIQRRYAALSPVVLNVPELTAGQAVTCMAAADWIDNGNPLCIHNADTAFEADETWPVRIMEQGADGGLLVFPSNEPRWSYARLGADGRVAEVREKKVISSWASTGTYWFRRGSDFVRLATEAHRGGLKDAGEYYVGPLFNDLIAGGGCVVHEPIRKLRCFGTPEDLDLTLKQLKAEGLS